MKKTIALLTLLLLAIACATHQNENFSKKYDVVFEDGVKGNETWEEDLYFQRVSWFRGATMAYDILLAELSETSKFRLWLDEFDQAVVKDCKRLFIGLLYYDRINSLKMSELTVQLEKQGFKRIIFHKLQDHISAHPVYNHRHLFQHKTYGFCMKDQNIDKANLQFDIAGFPIQRLRFPYKN